MQPTNFRTPNRWNSVPVPPRVSARIMEKIEKRPDGCWISLYSTASHGYSQIGWQDGGKRHVVLGHRAAWAAVNGQVPLGMTIDHTCKERRCVNPDHLRVISNLENSRRNNGQDWPVGAICWRGHTEDSLIIINKRAKNGERRKGTTCGECQKISKDKWQANNPAARQEIGRKYYARKRAESVGITSSVEGLEK